MILSRQERAEYVRPITRNGGAINTKTRVVDITHIPKDGGDGRYSSEIRWAVDFWNDIGYAIKFEGQTVQWVSGL